MDEDSTKMTIYNQESESILFEGEKPIYTLEFSKNQILVTGSPSQIYLIKEWCFVKCILDPNTANIYKGYAFVIPKFNELSFPFVVICGWQHISLLNIVTLEHKPLINGVMRSDKAGLQFVFAKVNGTDIEFHFSFKVRDKDGSGKNLI